MFFLVLCPAVSLNSNSVSILMFFLMGFTSMIVMYLASSLSPLTLINLSVP